MKYEGKEWVPKRGLVTAQLPRRSLTHLAGLVERYRFWEMDAEYSPDPFITDMDAITVSVRSGARVKSVRDYGPSGPEGLAQIAKSIEARVRRHIWGGRSAGKWEPLDEQGHR